MRARVGWVEEGEKKTVYFLNLEKSRANSKIMEKVTDENKHTVTKQADIMNVQKDFFSNLYKKKINSDEMEEKIDTFMRNTVTPTISVTQKDKCEGLVVETELLSALKQMKNGSASGIDGITVNFSNYFGITSKRL